MTIVTKTGVLIAILGQMYKCSQRAYDIFNRDLKTVICKFKPFSKLYEFLRATKASTT